MVTLCVVLGVGGTAFAQDGSGVSVNGEVVGGLTSGSSLRLRADASDPRGWQALHEIQIAVVDDGEVLEELVFDIEDSKLGLGDHEMVTGTGAVLDGRYLRVAGSDVVTTTGGANLSFGVTAEVLETIPSSARFRFTAVDDEGAAVSATQELGRTRGSGISWGSVLAAVVGALILGGILGSMSASRRRPPPSLSVYGTVRRRLDEEERAKPS